LRSVRYLRRACRWMARTVTDDVVKQEGK